MPSNHHAKGVSHYAATRSFPAAREHALSDAEAAKPRRNYLMDELPQRITQGPVKFRLLRKSAAEGDSRDDPTSTWPPIATRFLGHPYLDAKPSRISNRSEVGSCSVR